MRPEPEAIDLNLLFFNFQTKSVVNESQPQDSFELNAGLISALYEFAKLLNRPIQYLKFKKVRPSSGATTVDDFLLPAREEELVGTLITTRCDTYNLRSHVRAKIRLVYDSFVQSKLPLGPTSVISPEEEESIARILSDDAARAIIRQNRTLLDEKCSNFLEEMKIYGLLGVVICSFDMTPIHSWGFSLEETEQVLRNIDEIPLVDTYSWKYRQTNLEGTKLWAFIVNSGVGITIEGQFQEFNYVLISQPGSFLGEVPAKFYEMVNAVID